MSTTPTPVERAAEAIEDNTGLNGIIDGEAVALAALDAALDVDEIARVLADWFGPLDGAYTCDCDTERCPVLPCPTAVTVHEAAAAALIAHLTQTGATR